jgi:aminoglycoside phosphotransferase (APT) family kinase protein
MTLTDDLAYLATLLQRSVPGVGPVVGLEHVAEGYGATTLRALGGLAIRLPHTARLARRQHATAAALRRLAPHLPAAIPVPLWMLPISYPFETGAIGYRWIEGEQVDPSLVCEALARDIGVFLATLHGIDGELLDTFDGRIPGPADVAMEREQVMAVALARLRERQPPDVIARVEHWWDRFRGAQGVASYQPRVIHGDFWHGNLLVNDDMNRLAGVIDWEQVALDDPAQDLATLLHGGEAFANAVLAAYRLAGGTVDRSVLARRDRLWEYREFTGIALAVETGDEAETVDAMHKLETGGLRHLFGGPRA